MPAEARLETQTRGATRWITIHNEARLNAITAAMWTDLPGLIQAAEADPAVRAIAITGSGVRAFSAGADITEFDRATDRRGRDAVPVTLARIRR